MPADLINEVYYKRQLIFIRAIKGEIEDRAMYYRLDLYWRHSVVWNGIYSVSWTDMNTG